MNNKTKKQLADAISNALLQGEYIIKDDSDNGYLWSKRQLTPLLAVFLSRNTPKFFSFQLKIRLKTQQLLQKSVQILNGF